MRIISQDEKIDIPYDAVCVSINFHDNCQVIAWYPNALGDNYSVLATYSTKVKAKRAMEMLHKAYCPVYFMKGVTVKPDEIFEGCFTAAPASEETDIEIKKIENFYFQFPTDDELEG